MHSICLYCLGPDDKPVPVASVTCDEDARLEVRMLNGDLLASLALEEWGYQQLHAFPSPFIRPCLKADLARLRAS